MQKLSNFVINACTIWQETRFSESFTAKYLLGLLDRVEHLIVPWPGRGPDRQYNSVFTIFKTGWKHVGDT